MNLAEILSFLQNILPILTVILPVASGIIAYGTAIHKVHKDLEAEFDKELRTKRIETYPYLWRYLRILTHTEIIDFHDRRNEEILKEELDRLYHNLHSWYFESGMFLSISSRKQFDNLKCNMRNFFNKEKKLPDNDCIKKVKKMKRIEKKIRIKFNFLNSKDQCFKNMKEIEKMIKIGKNFRDSLANDIGGRREFF